MNILVKDYIDTMKDASLKYENLLYIHKRVQDINVYINNHDAIKSALERLIKYRETITQMSDKSKQELLSDIGQIQQDVYTEMSAYHDKITMLDNKISPLVFENRAFNFIQEGIDFKDENRSIGLVYDILEWLDDNNFSKYNKEFYDAIYDKAQKLLTTLGENALHDADELSIDIKVKEAER